jgi:H+/Cl- antiporter ClcA
MAKNDSESQLLRGALIPSFAVSVVAIAIATFLQGKARSPLICISNFKSPRSDEHFCFGAIFLLCQTVFADRILNCFDSPHFSRLN